MSGVGSVGDGDGSSPVLAEYLRTDRISLDLSTTSRKRLFEFIAELSCNGLADVSEDCILKTITERERLGSTGLGDGIAVPHGRIRNLDRPIISVVRLCDPIDYDAPDGEPVWLAVGLLVPVEANDIHLQLFSLLVTRFRDRHFVESMKRCRSREQVAALFDVQESDGQGDG